MGIRVVVPASEAGLCLAESVAGGLEPSQGSEV
jgi:hypothetical protein